MIIRINIAIVFIFLAMVLPALFLNKGTSQQTFDQEVEYLPQIRLAQENPSIFFKKNEYKMIKLPGHILFLSGIAHVFARGEVGSKTISIRMANALFGLALILLVWWIVYIKSSDPIKSAFLIAPLLFSYYFLSSSIWIFTDNAALLWVWTVLAILSLPNLAPGRLLLAGFFSALAIFWRQVHLWLLVPLFLKAWEVFRINKRPFLCLLALFIPCLVAGYFFILWGGLVSPQYQAHFVFRLKLINLIYAISLFGIFGLFFIGYIWKTIGKSFTSGGINLPLILSAILGLILALCSPSNFNRKSGRWGGALWLLAQNLPNIYGHSIIFLVLVPLGVVSVYFWFKSCISKDNVWLFVSLIAWGVAHMIYLRPFQRYFEPMLLIFFAFAASRISKYPSKAWIGPVLLAMVMAFVSFSKIYL